MSAVTVVIPAYNVARHIDEAIDSVRSQTMDEWSLVIVDDGSTDETPDRIRRHLDGGRIRLVQQQNRGVSAARNRGIAEADTEYVAFLDGDDAYEPTYLERMTARLAAEPELAFVCCDAFTFTDAHRRAHRCSQAYAMVPPVTLERVAARQFQVYTATTSRRRWLETVGGYDEALSSAEDLDLWLRILVAGGRAGFVGEPLAWYRIRHGATLSANTEGLLANTLTVYDKLRALDPKLAPICDCVTRQSVHDLALYRAKQAVRSGDMERFFVEADRALAHGANRKLSLAVALARTAPTLMQRLLAGRL
jgi:glycosyltransferase involved in cell wall biosynthesis